MPSHEYSDKWTKLNTFTMLNIECNVSKCVWKKNIFTSILKKLYRKTHITDVANFIAEIYIFIKQKIDRL